MKMVSAIVTTFKREPSMVLRAIKSILAQTYKDMEIIVVDDSPNDYPLRNQVKEAIAEIDKEYPNIQIMYIPHEHNMGACIARNTGLAAASGEYIAYLDDDDEWLPDKIEKQIRVIDDSDAALVYCGSLCKNENEGTCEIVKKEYIRGYAFSELLYGNFIESTSYPLIRKSSLQDIGGFDPLMQSAQDYDVWLRLAEKNEIDYVPEPLVIYHEHTGERITTDPTKKINGLERINAKYSQYLERDRKLWWKRHISIIPYYSYNHEYKKAFSEWLMCVKKRPEMIVENGICLLKIIKVIIVQRNKE